MFKRLVTQLKCFLFWHDLVLTGRRGYLLREWRCRACGRRYVSHRDCGSTLVPANYGSDLIFENWQKKGESDEH